jgi:Zn-dependent M28 family amino/carboxypeptidase
VADREDAPIERVTTPVGGSDVAAFLANGYDGVCLITFDEGKSHPGEYHRASDTLENLDLDCLMHSIDMTEKVIDGIVRYRLG